MTAATGVPSRAAYRDIFSVGEFRALFASQLASVVGDVIAAVAIMVLLYDRTGSTVLAASAMTLAFVPYLITGPVVPRVVGRWPARRTLVACDLVRGALVAVMLVRGLPIPVLLVLLFGVGSVSPLFSGTRAALMPRVLDPGPPYILGQTVMRIMAQTAQIAGNAIGGVLVGVLGARGALGIDVASFAVSAGLVGWGTQRRPRSAPEVRAAGRRRPGLRRVMAPAPVRRLLLAQWLIAACAVAPEALAAAYVSRLGHGPSALGVFLVGMPVGAVVADLVAGRLLSVGGQRRIMAPSLVVAAVGLGLFALRPALPLAIVLMFTIGLSFAYGPGLDRLLYDAPTPELRDATLAMANAGLMGVQGLGFAVWGAVAEGVPIRWVVAAAGVCSLLVAVTLRPWRPEGSTGRPRT